MPGIQDFATLRAFVLYQIPLYTFDYKRVETENTLMAYIQYLMD